MSLDQLSDDQRRLLGAWLPGLEVVADMSWGLVGTTVLHVRHGGESYVVKAGDERDGHLARELRAHREWLRPWTDAGRAAVLVHGDESARLLVTHYLPGVLVSGTPAEVDPDTYRQAGRLLATHHAQLAVDDATYEQRARDKTLQWLDREHRIAAEVEERLRAEVSSWPTPPSVLVPTHGDWQPRNWLWHDGTVSVIDLGRADLRPALTDLSRLAVQQFRDDPALEAAFLDGYGADPREPAAWHRQQVCEAVGTAVWAHLVGDERFEQQGHRMIAEALGDPV